MVKCSASCSRSIHPFRKEDSSMAKTILPYIISGISVGGQYALIAIGYTLVYGILRLINFAHGDVFMVAGLMMVTREVSIPKTVTRSEIQGIEG